MNKRDYRDLMIDVLKMQINYIIEDPNYDCSDYLQGQEMGLLIAIEKLKDTEFLLES